MMPKMTTEQFLLHLGVEVDQEFKCIGIDSSKTFRVSGRTLEYKNTGFNDWRVYHGGVGKLIDEEITPLPKYTLTDDEKAIVRNLPTCFETIGIYSDGTLCVREPNKERTWIPLISLFSFIKVGEYVSLDELRKCL